MMDKTTSNAPVPYSVLGSVVRLIDVEGEVRFFASDLSRTFGYYRLFEALAHCKNVKFVMRTKPTNTYIPRGGAPTVTLEEALLLYVRSPTAKHDREELAMALMRDTAQIVGENVTKGERVAMELAEAREHFLNLRYYTSSRPNFGAEHKKVWEKSVLRLLRERQE
ncbi:hypothetical protein KUW19_00600 [Ferrimonas balearica]|uniref:hypothetical protein n=1 Tax=Ferrimonas balearica TaxID=44012 RepID=UPI001C9676C0|nr:hypothetical protein [Ferrimonas balearica]MBY6104975.1 hypothetical protein [Ferrimonas balearica]